MASETRRQPARLSPEEGRVGLAALVGGAYQQCRDRALHDAATRAGVYTPALPLSRAEGGLRRERDGSRSGECRGKRGEDAEVGVKCDPLKTTDAERG